jgi:hypothetical protein
VLTFPENPRNAFTYIKRSNRTIKIVKGKTFEAREKASAEVMKIVNMADACTQLRVPSSKHTIVQHIRSCTSQMAAECSLTEDEMNFFREAITTLEQGREVVGSDEGEDMEEVGEINWDIL